MPVRTNSACSIAVQKHECRSQRLYFPVKAAGDSKVKKVFIRSGIRFDYLLAEKNRAFLRELCQYHVSGQLKVAPEHISDNVLKRMGKPENKVYRQFMKDMQR